MHYANSSAVRLANIYASHRIYCNRGVNGIEGCLSTAVGMSLDSSANVFCVIGDLAFFYDQNALWNNHLKGNMHILLLNNSGGGIFNMLPNISETASYETFVKAHHNANAQGICQQNNVDYMAVHNEEELKKFVTSIRKSLWRQTNLARSVHQSTTRYRSTKDLLSNNSTTFN